MPISTSRHIPFFDACSVELQFKYSTRDSKCFYADRAFVHGGSNSFFHMTHTTCKIKSSQACRISLYIKHDAHFKPFDEQEISPMGSAMWSKPSVKVSDPVLDLEVQIRTTRDLPCVRSS
jgi:hypothetical protein